MHETAEIIADLDRVIAKAKTQASRDALTRIREKALSIDREVLIEGRLPAAAVKTGGMMAITRGAQVVSAVGIVLTAYDLERAGERSVAEGSIKPLAAETVRQAGGWAGAELVGMAGVAVGIETGPGALITGLVGGVIGGVAGFIGADWAVASISSH